MGYLQADVVQIYPFTRQQEGDEVVIGRPDTGIFLALPAEAVELLDRLAGGRSIGEVEAEYERLHGLRPDLSDLLGFLESKGLVGREMVMPGEYPASGQTVAPKPIRYHFANIPQAVAHAFFGPLALSLYLATIGLAGFLLVLNPQLIPNRNSLFFVDNKTVKVLIVALVSYGSLFAHEFCHLLAARAVGVKSRFGISNRLWVLVAETDLTGLWAFPKNQRYLPMLAGPIFDAFSGSLIILLLFARSRGVLQFSPNWVEVARATLFLCLFRIYFQCFFFVRTDFYFVLTNFFGCKNLMGDTELFVRNQVRRLFGAAPTGDQSHIPARERKVISAFSWLWVLGRVFALAALFLITLPVLFRYFHGAWQAILMANASNLYQTADSLLVGVVNLAPLAIGIVLWLRTLAQRRTT
jgi:hypothetical protein